jgi:predicted house-cleaning noncanonical NTP pyrophosphatase (MazG superfamily)
MSETFSSPAALRKAQREVAEFHRFQALSDSLVEVNEKICQLRPVEGEEALREREKKRRKRSGKRSRAK